MGIAATTPQHFVDADDIRAFAVAKFVEPARQSGQQRFVIGVRPIALALGKMGVINHVCAALKSERLFQRPNGIRLVAVDGPPSGVSTTVVYTFEFTAAQTLPQVGRGLDTLLALRGVGKAAIAAAGGADALWRSLREGWEQ